MALMSPGMMKIFERKLMESIQDMNVLQDLATKRLEPSFGKPGDTVNINFPYVPGQWRTKDGTVLQISEMGTDHIQRCIGKIFRSKVGWRADHLPSLLEELKKRGVPDE